MYNLNSLGKIVIENTQGMSSMTLKDYIKDIVNENPKASFSKLSVDEQDTLMALYIESFKNCDIEIILGRIVNKQLANFLSDPTPETTKNFHDALRQALQDEYAYTIDEMLADRIATVYGADPYCNDQYENYIATMGGI